VAGAGLQHQLVEDVERIMEKRANNRAVMPEEFTTLGRFADIIQRRQMAARAATRQQRLAEVNLVRQTLPPAAFQMSVESLNLPEAMVEALRPMQNIGEIMLRFLIDERRLRHLLSDFPADSLRQVQEALDAVVLPAYVEPVSEDEAELAAEPEPVAEVAVDEESAPLGFIDIVEPMGVAPAGEPIDPAAPLVEAVFEEDDVDTVEGKKNKKKERDQRRQIVYDEDLGEMVVKRRRKGARGGETWGDWEE